MYQQAKIKYENIKSHSGISVIVFDLNVFLKVIFEFLNVSFVFI